MRSRFLAPALVLSLLGASALHVRPASAQAAPRRATSLSQILSAVPDSAMRERWRAAEREGALPALDALPVPDRPLAVRRRVVMRDTVRRVRPALPEGTVADVRVFFPPAEPPLRELRGPLAVQAWEPGRIVGTVAGASGPLSILYRLPGRPAGLARPSGQRVEVAVREGVEGGSARRQVLARDEEDILLFFVADGSARPYARQFEELPLEARQLDADGTGPAPVAVRFGDEEFVLRPGERRRVRDARGTLEVYLVASYYTAPRATALSEGDPYHVRLMVFRAEDGG